VDPLLILSDQPIAAEVRHVQEAAQFDLAWRRRLRRFISQCVAVYAVGVFLCFSSMGLTGDAADMALWSGLLLAEGAMLVFLLWSWARSLE